MGLGLWIWGVDSQKFCSFYLYFSFQGLKNHTEINQMPFGDAERSDSNINIFRGNMENVKNCQLSEYLSVIMLSSSKFPLLLSLVVS